MNISAKVITDSINQYGNRLRTLEIIFPRYILAELNTHRMLSKNSASSRAIPFNKMVQSVRDNPFIPYAWQKDHKGMQGTEYLDELSANDLDETWIKELTAKGLLRGFWGDDTEYNGDNSALYNAINSATNLNKHGVTKQLANRLLEPFMYHKVLISGTEWDNFFELRCPQYELTAEESPIGDKSYYYSSRKDFIKYCSNIIDCENWTILDWLKRNKGKADIHMMFLAEAIYDAINESIPKELKKGEWHLPYGDNIDENLLIPIVIENNYTNPNINTLDEVNKSIIKVSTARCARLSYQTLGDNPEINYEADLKLFNGLLIDKPIHASPAEHPSRVMTDMEYKSYSKRYIVKNLTDKLKGEKEKGITHIGIERDNNDNIIQYHVIEYGWCNNYRGFIQLRKILENDNN